MAGGDGPKRSVLYRFGNFVSSQLKEGFTIDDVAKGNEKLLKAYLPPTWAKVLHFIFVYFLGHLYIGYAIGRPLLDRLKQQHGIYKLKESVSFLRSEFTICLIAISAFFHVWSLPSVLHYFNWAFTLRPQINVKPQMTVVTRRSRSAISLPALKEVNEPLEAAKSSRSKSVNDITECYSSGPTSVDLNWDVRIRDGVTDKIWSGIERVSDTASLASGLHDSFFNSSLGTSSVASGTSDYAFDAKELDDPTLYGVWNDVNEVLPDDSLLPVDEMVDIPQSDEDYDTAPENSEADC
uniref:MLO-like protein n=1 Tax=Panagrellus redivivus TaxID=6233 RepID=A0A7E4UVV7_PANRE